MGAFTQHLLGSSQHQGGTKRTTPLQTRVPKAEVLLLRLPDCRARFWLCSVGRIHISAGKAWRRDGSELTSVPPTPTTPRTGPLRPRSSSHPRPAPSLTRGPTGCRLLSACHLPHSSPPGLPKSTLAHVPRRLPHGSWLGGGTSSFRHTSPDSVLTKVSLGGLLGWHVPGPAPVAGGPPSAWTLVWPRGHRHVGVRSWSHLSCPAPQAWQEQLGWSVSGPHLLAEGAQAHIIQAVQLKGLPQHGVEGLGDAVHRGGVGGHGEGGHQAHLLHRAGAVHRLVQQVVVLQVLCQPLEHRQGLIKVDLRAGGRAVRPLLPAQTWGGHSTLAFLRCSQTAAQMAPSQ